MDWISKGNELDEQQTINSILCWDSFTSHISNCTYLTDGRSELCSVPSLHF